MTKYIIKRLLLMVPTFLLITVVIFGVINLAPGNPGQSANASGSERADQSANAREGYRLFKEQYNLDQPVMLNFRFLLEREDVQGHLETIARNMGTPLPGEREALGVGARTASVLSEILNADVVALQERIAAMGDGAEAEVRALRRELQEMEVAQIDDVRPLRPEQGDVFHAEEDVENWGNDVVPFLVQLASEYLYVVPEGTEDPWQEGEGVVRTDLPGELGEAALTGAEAFDWRDGRWRIQNLLTEKVRFLAVQRLSVNARRRVVVQPGERANEERLSLNREIMLENNTISQWTYDLDATAEERAEIIGRWSGWLVEHRDRFERDGVDTARMLFLQTRFARYWGNLARLDLGTSIRYRRPVLDVITDHWQYSIFLSLTSLLLAYSISVPLGVLAAVKQRKLADRGIGIVLFILYSLPSFFLATLLQTYLTRAKGLDWFPVSGFRENDPLDVTTWQMVGDVVWHLVLPLVCMTYGGLAALSRYARTGLLDVIRSDYIRTARAKGLPESVVIVKHAVRNGMIPILTLLGTTLPVLIGGSIIIEYIFVIDGMGKLMITAIQFRDYNIIMGELLIASVLTLFGILLSDVSYALVDPRISFE